MNRGSWPQSPEWLLLYGDKQEVYLHQPSSFPSKTAVPRNWYWGCQWYLLCSSLFASCCFVHHVVAFWVVVCSPKQEHCGAHPGTTREMQLRKQLGGLQLALPIWTVNNTYVFFGWSMGLPVQEGRPWLLEKSWAVGGQMGAMLGRLPAHPWITDVSSGLPLDLEMQ